MVMQALIPPLGNSEKLIERLKKKTTRSLRPVCYMVSPRSARATQEDPVSKSPGKNSSSILTLAFEEF